MTGAELITSVRVILRDTGRGASTTARFYSDDAIINALVRARQDTVNKLFELSDLAPHSSFTEYLDVAGEAMPIHRPRITLSGLYRQVAYSSAGQAVPNDFWRIECGVEADGSYVKTEATPQAVMMANTFEHIVYARGGSFFGTLCTVHYWANPSVSIANDSTNLNAGATPLSDAFYNTMKYKAISYLIDKEKADKDNRLQLAMTIWNNRLRTLR